MNRVWPLMLPPSQKPRRCLQARPQPRLPPVVICVDIAVIMAAAVVVVVLMIVVVVIVVEHVEGRW